MNQDVIGQNIGYIRVSTLLQNTARQEDQLNGYEIDELFIDYASGKDSNRPQLQAALKHLRKGDIFIVQSMDRLARNLDDLRSIVKDLTLRQIKVQFLKESLTFTGNDSSISNLLLSVMGAFAEFERALIRERQREGIAIAKSRGKYIGRKRLLSKIQVNMLIENDKKNNHRNRSALAREFCISRQTLYNYLNKN